MRVIMIVLIKIQLPNGPLLPAVKTWDNIYLIQTSIFGHNYHHYHTIFSLQQLCKSQKSATSTKTIFLIISMTPLPLNRQIKC